MGMEMPSCRDRPSRLQRQTFRRLFASRPAGWVNPAAGGPQGLWTPSLALFRLDPSTGPECAK